MSVIKVRWHVDELANVLALFDTQKVYRSVTGDGGPFVEVTNAMTRVPLVPGVADYLYDDTAGGTAYYYRVSYYNQLTLLESAPSAPVRGDLAGYVTLADIRNEGFGEALVTDAQIAQAAWIATTLIDRATSQWFEPRRRQFRLDGRGTPDLFLGIPIIGLLDVQVGLPPALVVPRTRDSIAIYNRHLTQGLLTPDDRNNPRVGYAAGDGRWTRGTQNVYLDGYFGHTESGPDDAVGETAPGSQYPVAFGRTPALIHHAAILLTVQLMWGLAGGRGEEFRTRSRVVSESTRDQSYTLAPLSAADAEFGITGNVEVDGILALFAAPFSAGGV